MSQDNTNLIQRLDDWIGKQGYPLEMEVASAFQSLGLNVAVSSCYTDKETGTLREIDVFAEKYVPRGRKNLLRIQWVIECKLTSDKPWVCFSINQPFLFTFAYHTMCSPQLASYLRNEMMNQQVLDKYPSNPILSPKNVCHSVTQSFTTGADVPYQALMGVSKACADFTNQTEEIKDHSGWYRQKGTVWTIAFPIVIISGKLFECHIGNDGRRSICERGRCVVPWRKVGKQSLNWPIIHIVTQESMADFMKDVEDATEILESDLMK